MIEIVTTVVVVGVIGSALFRTYKTLKAQREVDAHAMDDSFATHVPPWDEGTDKIDPEVENQTDWFDYWFHDEDGHDEVEVCIYCLEPACPGVACAGANGTPA